MSSGASTFIIVSALIALAWAFLQYTIIAQISFQVDEEKAALKGDRTGKRHFAVLKETYEAIQAGAEAFLRAEYSIYAIFVAIFSVIIFMFISYSQNAALGFLTTLSYVLGAATSAASGYIGMLVAVFSNVRTTINARKDGWTECFNTAFRAGSVMGFALSGLGILVLYLTLLLYSNFFEQDHWILMMECISGYGLGGSFIAMFGRVGGGIYTKAADVGADLVGKVVHGIPEVDPRNPATIADNFGDNVGDVAGMGDDLFGSFAESTCVCSTCLVLLELVLRALLRIIMQDFFWSIPDHGHSIPIVEAAKRRAGGIIQLQTSSTCAEREGSTKLYDNHDNHDYHHHHDLLLPLKRTADTRRGGLVVVGRQTLSFFFVFMLLYSPVIVEAFSFLPRQQAVSRQQWMSQSRLFAAKKWIALTPGNGEPFGIKIGKSIQDVDDLKKAIKKEKANTLRDIDADEIELEYPLGTVLAPNSLPVLIITGGNTEEDPIYARLPQTEPPALQYLKKIDMESSDLFDAKTTTSWVIRGLHLAGLSSSDQKLTHYVRDHTRKVVRRVLDIDERSPRLWETGSPGGGKSTTLYAILNSPAFASKGFLWVHASDVEYTVVLKKKNGDTYHGIFKLKDWGIVEAILFEDDNIDVEYTVLDGVDESNMRTWFAKSCKISNQSKGKKKVIACTSYQTLNYSTENLNMMGYFDTYEVDSWSLDEYIAGFDEGALKTVAKDKDKLLQKYYYAGGNMRLMLQEVDTIKKILDGKIRSVGNFESLLRRQVGEGSFSAVNTLTQSFGGEFVPLSKYVMDCLSKKVSLAFVDQAAAILLDNQSWQGWVFELRLMVLLRDQRSLNFVAMNGTRVSWTADHPVIIDIDASDHTRLPTNLPNGCWLKPIKYDQACFDLIYYHWAGRVDYFQFTIAKEDHEYKLKYIANMLPALANPLVDTNTVNLFVVVPIGNQCTFRVTPGNLKDYSDIARFDQRWSNIPAKVCEKKSASGVKSTIHFDPLQILYFDN